MSGSKMTTQRKAILAATKKTPPGGDYVWGGKDENDRPLTREEMQKGVEAYRKKRGHPVSAARKEQVGVSGQKLTNAIDNSQSIPSKRKITYG